MWEEISAIAINSGLLPALFVALLIYVLHDTSKREKKYQDMEKDNREIISRLSLEIHKDVIELKSIAGDIHKDVSEYKTKQEKSS